MTGLRKAEGFHNRDWIDEIVRDRDTLVAWGNVNVDPEYLRAIENQIMQRAERTFCLGVTKLGFPRHPSRLAYATACAEWTSERRAAA